MAWFRGKLAMFLLIFQIVFLVLFGVFVEYGPAADARTPAAEREEKHGYTNTVDLYYSLFQDVHVMIFMGIAFLLTFLRRYSWGSATFNFLAGAFVLQWATLVRGFLDLHDGKILVNVETMLGADFTAGTVLISFCAVVGRISPLQLVIMAFIEVVFASVNEHIVFAIFGAVDVGGSMVVHAFGGYFGLTVSRVLAREAARGHLKENTNYTSDLTSFLGTIFLWIFWPSFNSALAVEDARHRAILNTYFSLGACTVMTYALSGLMNKSGKLQMEHIQNATLAGGVVVGTIADLMIFPWGAVLCGCIAGFVSTFGFAYITPFLADKLKLQDTCGVHNLHGMPAIISALGGAVAASLADESLYGENLYTIFSARAPKDPGDGMVTNRPDIEEARSAMGQAGYQLASLALTLGMAIVGGLIAGLIMKLPVWNEPENDELYDDFQNFQGADETATAGLFNSNPPVKKRLAQEEADDKL